MNELLARLLASRELLVQERLSLLEQHQLPVLTLTLNTPGPDKWLPAAERLFTTVRSAVPHVIVRAGWRCLIEIAPGGMAFPACLWAISAPVVELKRLTIAIETATPIGRLLDLDVTDARGRPVTRAALSLPPRPCLLCGAPVHACRLTHRHRADEVVAAFISTVELGHRLMEDVDLDPEKIIPR